MYSQSKLFRGPAIYVSLIQTKSTVQWCLKFDLQSSVGTLAWKNKPIFMSQISTPCLLHLGFVVIQIWW